MEFDLRNSYKTRTTAFFDSIILICISILAAIMTIVFHPFERFIARPIYGESLIFAAFLTICVTVFALRRLREAERELIERKQVEEVLRESNERFKSFMDSATDSFSLYDSNLNLVDINEVGLSWFPTATKKEDIVGKHILEVTPYVKETGRYDKYVEVMKMGTPFYTDDVVSHPSFGARHLAVRAFKVGEGLGFIATDITERKQMEELQVERAAAQARAEGMQQSRQHIITAQEALRKEIAQQVHGSVQNKLIVLMHWLTDLKKMASTERMAKELNDLRDKLEEVLEDQIRPISHRLYPSILRRGLVPATQSLTDQFEAVVPVELEVDEDLTREERSNANFIPEQVRLLAYRISEEALVNITKHAKASKVTVILGLAPGGWLHLAVRDNGQGFVMGNTDGMGLHMMQDYAEVAGGSCIITSVPGKGTEITATFLLGGTDTECPERA